MLKIAICDDDIEVIRNLSEIIYFFCDHQKHDFSISTFSSGLDLLEKETFFNIIFLDIDMPEMNGIQTAKIIRNWDKNVFIIYVTSYPDYKNLAFAVHAFGYIQKPIERKKIYYYLSEALNYQEQKSNQKILTLKTEEGFLKINANTIYYFEYTHRKTKIVTEKGNFLSSYQIGELFDKLNSYGFSRPHKSFVINLLQVSNVKGFEIEMMNGDVLPLAQKKVVEFKKQLNDCLQETFEVL